MSGDITIGYLKRLSTWGNYLAGQLKSAVSITGGTITGVSLSNNINSAVVKSAQTDNTTTTLGVVTGLSLALVAGGQYKVQGYLPVTCASGGGVKISIDTSDTLSLTSGQLTTTLFTASGVAAVGATALNSAMGSTAAVIAAELEGTLVVNAAGTLVIKAAQNAATTTTTSILLNGNLQVTRLA
jgi:hypothetical protein